MKLLYLRTFCFALLINFFAFTSFTQSLPENLRYNEEDHMLLRELADNSDFYRLMEIDTIYLEFYDTDFWTKMTDNVESNTYVMAGFKNSTHSFDSVGVQFKGNTSYRNAVKSGSEKLSFAIQLNEFIAGQDIEGYNNFNLNNAWGDNSMMIEVLYAELARKHIPTVRANFVRLFLNGEDWGIYPNVQQVNSDFLKEWYMTNNGARWRADSPDDADSGTTGGTTGGTRPTRPGGGGGGSQWGNGTAAINYLGSDTGLYQQYYTLKSSNIDNPWDKLVKVSDVLNNTDLDALQDSLRNYLSIDETLWYLATEILFSDDDSYIYKGKMDYFIYYDKYTQLINLIEMDGNSAMATKNVSWDLFYNADNENYPLLHRLLQIPELRQRYIAHAKTILTDGFDDDYAIDLIESLQVLIRSHVSSDPKKNFTMNEFSTAVTNLKSYITERKSIIESNAEMQLSSPLIEEVSFAVDNVEGANPNANEALKVTATATHASGIFEVYLYYATDLFGNFIKVKMESEGDAYIANIPGMEWGEYIRFYVEAVADNAAQTRAYSPKGAEHNVYMVRVNLLEEVEGQVVINEVMASNNATLADDFGDYDDWVELYNTGSEAVALDGYFLSDNATALYKYRIPEGTTIDANDYLIIWTDDDESQLGLHTNFKLSASGEELFLSNPQGEMIDQMFFTNQLTDVSYARSPNGLGAFTSLNPTPLENNDVALAISDVVAIDKTLKVYPNPTTGIVYFEEESFRGQTISIYNMVGSLVYQQPFEKQVNLSHLQQGMYLVKIGEFTSRILKQ